MELQGVLEGFEGLQGVAKRISESYQVISEGFRSV